MKYLHHLFNGGSSTDLIHSTWTPVDHIKVIGDSNFFVVLYGPVLPMENLHFKIYQMNFISLAKFVDLDYTAVLSARL